MARRKKEHWAPANWIEFGNRVKKLRGELQSMLMDVQCVCRAKELRGLMRVLEGLDKWKCSMEDVASEDVPETIVTRIFYGDPIPRDDAERKQLLSIFEPPPKNSGSTIG
jgi:hypothetical protein